MQHTANLWPSHVIPYDVNLAGTYNSVDRSGGGVPPAATPVSTAMYGTTSTCSWAHTVPSLMPWMPQGGGGAPGHQAGVQESIVQFSGGRAPFPPDPCTSRTATSWELLNNFNSEKQSNANLHLKRKNDLEQMTEGSSSGGAPHKLCITEERMAARFKEMHISNHFSLPTAEAFVNTQRINNIKDLDMILNANRSGSETLSPSKSLVLAPEIKKLVEPEKLFANTFLNKVERPTMALVLWEPQNNPILRNNEDFHAERKEEENSNVFASSSQNTPLCSPGLLSDLCLQTADKCQQTTFDEEMGD